MTHQFELASRLPLEYREDLEALMFFNPQQRVAGSGVVESIEKFGTPQISVVGGQLRITLGQSDVQPLFALAGSDEGFELAGLVLYVRSDSRNVIVLHVAVTERFSAAGADADAMLVMRLLQAVVHSARRLVGVQYVTIMYSQGTRRARLHTRTQVGAPPKLASRVA
jgi:hypothetical protein